MKKLREMLQDRTSTTIEFLKNVQQAVRTVVPEADVILYGSRARGDARPVSDWDFLILVERPVSWGLVQTVRNSLYDLELQTDRVISSIVRTRQEWNSPKYSVMPFRKEVERDGVIL